MTFWRLFVQVSNSQGKDILWRYSLQAVPPGSLHVIIDSVDTLATDLASDSQTYKFIRSLLSLITSRSRA